ncbi:uncharacterized protein N7483_005928 [Penicillium malachiteum]|uniref:uncharacterized protein n=1 Tax=Penicillium malachiteum TaxID=1324776 RepID=UPI0025468D51|nr:uncharacterized protein N7483_005928 [Penicillium malachiteum]KAJ5731420.1 hypothetical protein N7483_005928 [Penicillium malachiteum]
MLSMLVLLLASAVAMVSCQYTWTPTIDPNSVPMATRENWCLSQTSSCPILCMQMPNTTGANANTCSAKTLTFNCQCNNGLSPNASEYSETIPYFVCTEANNQCVNKCSDSSCQAACRDDHPCGAQHPTPVNTSTATISPGIHAASTTTVASVFTETATGKAPRLLVNDMSHIYGLCVVIGGFIAGFAILL